jgi:hypothetical protein
MSTIRFTAEISPDQTIHLPPGVQLPPGKADVVVTQPARSTIRCADDEALPPGVPDVAKKLASFADDQLDESLPSDFASNHDHYLHGAPKGIDQP